MSEFKLEKRKVTDLISDIHNGDIQLPQFQRDYKWKPSAVLKLIDSINKLHPAGSLLFLEIDTSKEPFIAYEKVRTAPDSAGDVKPSYLILDGQQRLTSCHSALTNSGTKTYFIDLKTLQKKYNGSISTLDLVDDKILIVKNNVSQPDQLLFSKNLLPFSFLLKRDDPQKSKEELRIKLYNYRENLRNDEKGDKDLLQFVETKLENFLDSFFDYQFPTVILPKDLDIAGVCKVFQTINTTGLKLSAFDICVATFMPHGINLKEKLTQAKSNFPEIEAILSDDETIILQTIALLAGVSPKSNTLPNFLKTHHIHSYWQTAEEYLSVAVDVLDKIGVGLSKGIDLLPYQPIVPILSSSLANVKYKSKSHGEQTNILNKLRKWFYSVCLDLRFSEGTDNKMKDDTAAIIEWISSNKEPEYITNGILWNSSKIINANKNGAFGKTIIVAINSNKPLDFYTPESVGFGPTVTANCQQHHIFPDAKYKANDKVSSVFNFTYITTKSNQYIKDKRTSEYISGIITETGITELAFKEKLSRHFIDEICYKNLQKQEMDEFLKNRVTNIYNFLKENIGVKLSVATQNEYEEYVDIDSNFEDSGEE